MIYLFAIVVGLIHIIVNAHFKLWGGEEQLIPTFILLSASLAVWRQWFMWLIVLIATAYFTSLSHYMILSLILFSGLSFYFFSRWIDRENPIATVGAASLLFSAYVLLLAFSTNHHIDMSSFGTILLSLPIILGWYTVYKPTKGRV